MSVPNQKILIINKPSYTEKFLQIGISEWQQACKNMNAYSTFCLYLYLASNMNGFNLELSKEAFFNATGFKKTAYYDGLQKLQELGYLVHAHGNKWLFYTSPVRFGGDGDEDAKTDTRSNGNQIPQKRSQQSAKANSSVRSGSTEIDNIDKTNKIDSLMDFGNEDTMRHDIMINEYLSKLSADRKSEYAKMSTSINRSSFWLKEAILNKEPWEWEKYGFGLLMDKTYVKEIDEKVKLFEDRQKRITEGIQKQMAERDAQPRITVKQGKRTSIRERAISLEDIDMLEEK